MGKGVLGHLCIFYFILINGYDIIKHTTYPSSTEVTKEDLPSMADIRLFES